MGCISNLLSTDPCCGRIHLWISATIVAGIEIVFSATIAVLLILSITTVSFYKTKDAFEQSGISTFLNFWNFGREDESSTNGVELDEIKTRLYNIYIVMLAVSLVVLVVASILFYAALRRRLFLVRVWLLFKAGGISLCIIYLLTTFFLSQATVIGALLDLAQIGVLLYFFWVVYAFMMELTEEQIFKMSPSIVNSQGKIDDVSFPL